MEKDCLEYNGFEMHITRIRALEEAQKVTAFEKNSETNAESATLRRCAPATLYDERKNMKKNLGLSWQYDEFKQVGTDYSSVAEVEIYDSSHADFRNIEAESVRVLDLLKIKEGNSLIDFGSGTGTFAIQAARRCTKVHAIDVSQPMIEHATAKATKAGISNIEFHHAGFLTYDHKESPVDAVVTTFAFHHLPDFWKGIALKRVNSMLKPAGQLYLHDVIMEETNALENIAAFVDKLATAGGTRLQEDTERHFRDEYSTYDWVMDGLLLRAGFTIKSKHIDAGVLGTYICTKN